jgi:hypothetical protein
MPQIQRSEVLEVIEQLERFMDEKNFNLKIFNKTMDWLNVNQFYLTSVRDKGLRWTIL